MRFLKNIKFIILNLFILIILSGCKNSTYKPGFSDSREDYYVAAYIWPSCHDEPMSREVLWSEGIGEWEMIKKGTPRFDGHYQPRVPLWGYVMDDDPLAVEKKIDAATDHGVNVFIYDWYWYDGKPFLEEALDEGFLKARNRNKMDFYILWANMDIPGNLLNSYRYPTDSIIWTGRVDWDNFKKIVDRVINKYFSQPNYFRINDEPVFSIIILDNLVKSFGNLEETKKALDYFRDEVKKAGFPGLHIQLIGHGGKGTTYLIGEKYAEGKTMNDVISILGINSITKYNWSDRLMEDYIKWAESSMAIQRKWDSILTIPFFPNVSIGWDNTPRYPDKGKESVIHINNSPESFAAYLIKAKDYADNHPEQPKLIIINAWNEWIEGSYLEPDMRWGYGYLEAVREVMSGKYDKFSVK